jgi:hypothetical protein
MMYDHEKSDLATVVLKSTNKAGQPGCGVGGAKGGGRGECESASTGRHSTGEPCHRRWSAYGKLSRFAVRHPRWEKPYARIGPVRICAGGREVTRVPTATAAGPRSK